MRIVLTNDPKKESNFSLRKADERLLKQAVQIEDFNRRVKSGEIIRYSYGMYYIPGQGVPESSDAIALRYISNDKEVYGFYTGDCFLKCVNGAKISVNDKIELMTNKATSGKKKVYMFGRRFIKIKQNYSVLADYIKKTHLAANDVMEMAPHFPAKTASKLLASDLYRSLWKH